MGFYAHIFAVSVITPPSYLGSIVHPPAATHEHTP
jgi:hypothetical protein